jgi:rhodanese-related sulfurtransferase
MTKKSRHTNTVSSQAKQEKQKLQIGLVVLLVALVAIGAILFINAGQPASASSLPATISTERAYQMYQEGALLLDVREQFEWDEVHVPNTTLIPLGELANRVSELPKDTPIVVICRSGNRSDQGRDILKQAGFTNVTSMDGGVVNWRNLGYPTVP